MSKVLVIGDFISDVSIYGHSVRMCPEDPTVPVIVPDKIVTTDGGAGLVVAQLKALGDVEIEAVYGTSSRKNRYFSGTQLLTRIDEDSYFKQEVPDLDFNSYACIIISDYAKGTMTQELANKILAGTVTVFVDAKANWEWYKSPNVILVPNEHEAANAKFEDFLAIIRKRGPKGASLNEKVISTSKVENANTCGAGDIFLAALVWHVMTQDNRHSRFIKLERAISFANKVAGISVAHLGFYTVSRKESGAKFGKIRPDLTILQRTARGKHMWRRFKKTPEDYQRALDEQSGKCAICREPPNEDSNLCWDHDHECCPGEITCGNCIRGLIHKNCNLILGYSQENTDILRGAISYLDKQKSQKPEEIKGQCLRR